jgi:hypothetical protein
MHKATKEKSSTAQKVGRALAEALAEKVNLRFIKVFYSVFDKYQSGAIISGSIPALKPSRNPGAVPSGRASGRCKPTASDFIADVELAAKHVLNPSQLRTFFKMASMIRVPDTTKFNIVADLVGSEFKRRGIYPLKQYFADTYVVPVERRRR